jgi:CRISPR-associated protein Csd1
VTVLQALDRYYDRMEARGEAEPLGFSREKIGFAVELSADGEPVAVIDLRIQSGKRLAPRLLSVPAALKRTVAIAPNFLWDKTAYALGRTAGSAKRTAQEHEAFRALHRDLLAGSNDPGLVALRRFLESWRPERFDSVPFLVEMLDSNIVFRLEGDLGFVHERDAARELSTRRQVGAAQDSVFCLVTGRRAPAQRLHPTIKGVNGAQTSGAALVSFNLDAFTSYGKEQGDNAPTSEQAAFRYGAALNGLLERDSRNRLRRGIGDATVVFWADTSAIEDEGAARAAEDCFAQWTEPPNDESEAKKVREQLARIAAGEPIEELKLGLDARTKFHVLGLSPNAARLSIRYWLSDDFGAFVERLARHYRDLTIEPPPWGTRLPSIEWLLTKTTAAQEKAENVQPVLAGELTRAVLQGMRYPRALLSGAVVRLRAGDDPGSGWHAAAIRAVLLRERRLALAEGAKRLDVSKEGLPVGLDRDNPNAAYQLGRLFAAVETAQRMALGRVNAPIRDRYFGAASATPASVFPLLMRGVQSHLGKLRKSGKGFWLEREIEEINDRLPPELPRSLKLEAQGRFVLGYYHQRKGQFMSREAQTEIESTDVEEDANGDG